MLFVDMIIVIGNATIRDHRQTQGLELQGSHRLEKYLNLEGFLEKSLKITNALKSS